MQYRTLGRTGLRVSEIGFGGAQDMGVVTMRSLTSGTFQKLMRQSSRSWRTLTSTVFC